MAMSCDPSTSVSKEGVLHMVLKYHKYHINTKHIKYKIQTMKTKILLKLLKIIKDFYTKCKLNYFELIPKYTLLC